MDEIDYFVEGLNRPHLVCTKEGDGFRVSMDLSAEEAVVIIELLMDQCGLDLEPLPSIN